MRVVEILLPLTYASGEAIPEAIFDLLKQELAEKFGGVTAYSRSPAEGLWRDEGHIEQDAIVIFEVMTEQVDKDWWSDLRTRLEALFRQEEIVIRTFRSGRI